MQPSTLESSTAVAATASHLPYVLLAEDDPNLRRLVALGLRRSGYAVVEAEDGREVLQILANRALGRCSLIGAVMDVRMPGHSGLAILRALAHAHDPLPVVMMTAFGDAPTHRRAHEYGARQVLDKPFTLGSLCEAAEHHFRTASVPATDLVWEPEAHPSKAPSDTLLVDRYLDVFNRAVGLRRSAPRFGRIPRAPHGPVELRIIGGHKEPSYVCVGWWEGRYDRLVGPFPAETWLSIEITRQHMEDAIENPWMFYARPELFVLWQ